MTFDIRAEGVDVQEVMARVRARIAEKKRGLLTEDEVREISEHRLPGVLDAHDFRSRLLAELQENPSRWNYAFEAQTVFRSSRGISGRLLEAIRRILGPVQKLFWNPNPMIAALSRQADLNPTFVHLLHNLAAEVTRLNLEVQDLKNRNLQLLARVEFLARREKTLEGMVAYREGRAEGEEPAGGSA